MPKYRVSINWYIDVDADSEEEAMEQAYWYWDQDNDFSRDAKITKRRK